jgi:CheY-like chemotaxis protein
VPDSKVLKLLIVEDSLEDEQLLSEALLEIEENRLWCNWRTSAIFPVERLADAIDALTCERFDAILLNLSLPDSPTLLDSFLEVRACARDTPILVLADDADDHLANRLLRDGAQDVVVKSEMECLPLARAIRFAVERQRRASYLAVGMPTVAASKPAMLAD